MDRKIRKLLNIYGAFHIEGDVNRLYIECSKGCRGLISVEDSVGMEIESLREYVWKSGEKLLKEVHSEGIMDKGKKKDEIRKQRQVLRESLTGNAFGQHNGRKGC